MTGSDLETVFLVELLAVEYAIPTDGETDRHQVSP
jgi:hypothetical protein